MAQSGIVSDVAPMVRAILEDYRKAEILLSDRLEKVADTCPVGMLTKSMAGASDSARITADDLQAVGAISGHAPPVHRPIHRRAAYSSLASLAASPEAAIIASATSPALARIACSTASLTSP